MIIIHYFEVMLIPAVPSIVLGDSVTETSRSSVGGGLVITTQTSTALADSRTV